jgi:hypothetical protein
MCVRNVEFHGIMMRDRIGYARQVLQSFCGLAVLGALFFSWLFALTFWNRVSVLVPLPLTSAIYLVLRYANRCRERRQTQLPGAR